MFQETKEKTRQLAWGTQYGFRIEIDALYPVSILNQTTVEHITKDEELHLST